MAANPASAPTPPDLSSLCVAATEHAPLPMATLEGATHIVRQVNSAFCRLLDKSTEKLVGKPFSDEFHATIRGYSKLDSTGPGEAKQFGLPGFTDYPSEIQVLAGEYKVQVYCFNGFTSYRPSTTVALQSGKTYWLKCEVRDDQAVVNVHASDTD